MNKTRIEMMAKVFNELAERYKKNPELFVDVLDGSGNIIDDYGVSCAHTFVKIESEIFADQ